MINIYCDESCHLEHDKNNAMILGTVFCDSEYKSNAYNDIREIKLKYQISSWAEIKWTKVSNSKIDFYLELLNYFSNNDHLYFRAVVAKNKCNLDHKKYNNNDHNLWYYKTYYYLLDPIISYDQKYNIYIDIKDTNSSKRVEKLKEVLCNNQFDFKQEVIRHITQIKSHTSELLQIADLLIGALNFYHNGHYKSPNSSSAKNKFVDKIIEQYGSNFINGNRPSYQKNFLKFDVFLWNLR